MKQLYKSQDFKLNSYKDLYKCLYGKSKYLKSLEKKKNESYNIVTDKKLEMIKEKLLRTNQFRRDYSIFSKQKLFIKPESTKTNQYYFTPDIKPLFLSLEEINYPNRYRKKKFDIDNFSLIYKETNSSNYSKQKPLKVLNTSSYSKLNQKGKYKGNNSSNNNNCCINYEDGKNFEISNKSNVYNASSNIFNKSTISNNTSSFLTSIGNNVILNKIKKSN